MLLRYIRDPVLYVSILYVNTVCKYVVHVFSYLFNYRFLKLIILKNILIIIIIIKIIIIIIIIIIIAIIIFLVYVVLLGQLSP